MDRDDLGRLADTQPTLECGCPSAGEAHAQAGRLMAQAIETQEAYER
ncbi:hypothetical protein [Streptomyces sp. NPDC005078]